MTNYTDLPAANTLCQQREIVTNAIAMLDAGGAVSNLMIAPPPDMPPGQVMMSASIAIPPPTPPSFVAEVRAWLIGREADLDSQLAALGVTDPPPASA
jgi:hypothetical protein